MSKDTKLMAVSRRNAREFALRALYAWLVNDTSSIDGLRSQQLLGTEGLDVDFNYFDTMLRGVIRCAPDLEEIILPHLDRTLKSLSPVEHAVLLIGSFEMLEQKQIPYRVIINEAVELTKSYGGTDGYKFVNGVLDKLVATIRPKELNAH